MREIDIHKLDDENYDRKSSRRQQGKRANLKNGIFFYLKI